MIDSFRKKDQEKPTGRQRRRLTTDPLPALRIGNDVPFPSICVTHADYSIMCLPKAALIFNNNKERRRIAAG
jgi:hypothetical protein